MHWAKGHAGGGRWGSRGLCRLGEENGGWLLPGFGGWEVGTGEKGPDGERGSWARHVGSGLWADLVEKSPFLTRDVLPGCSASLLPRPCRAPTSLPQETGGQWCLHMVPWSVSAQVGPQVVAAVTPERCLSLLVTAVTRPCGTGSEHGPLHPRALGHRRALSWTAVDKITQAAGDLITRFPVTSLGFASSPGPAGKLCF